MKSFFAPGRTELAGNHTDHQKGRVLASAVDKGIHAAVEPNFDNVARIRSAGFPDMNINLLDLDVHPEEFGSSEALVRGVAAAMYDIGASFGGFDATLESELSAGSGLSSSAAFAVLMCRIFNGLYNNSELEPQRSPALLGRRRICTSASPADLWISSPAHWARPCISTF